MWWWKTEMRDELLRIADELEVLAPCKVTEGRLLNIASRIRAALASDEDRPPDVPVEN